MVLSIRSVLCAVSFGVACLLLSPSASAHTKASTTNTQLFQGTDSAPAKVVQQFHQALQTGDTTAVLAQLADDVVIYEGGSVERSKAEYQQHHLAADIAYLKPMHVELLEHQVQVHGDSAVSISRSHTTGTYKQKAVDRQGMETITLRHIEGRWLITHIHWSN